MNWRELKKELFDSPPRPRTSNTYQHDDIFNSKQPSVQYEDNVGRSSFRTPKRIRENDTTRSHLFDKSETKGERPMKSTGIRTFKAPKTIQEGKVGPCRQQSAYKIKDHADDYFYILSEDDFKGQMKCLTTQPSPGKQETKELSNHKIRKQEEILGNEVGKLVLSPDHTQIQLTQKSKSQYDIIDRQLLHEFPNATCREKRLLHNESNIFQNENYQKKVMIPLQKSPQKKDIEYEVPKKITQQQQEFDPSEIDSIKRKNHLFSDVFGLEYGSRDAVHAQKSQQRNLSPALKWTDVDTIKNRKDLGGNNKPAMIHSRSRLMDQKSYSDTHSFYENYQVKPLNKDTRISSRNEQVNKNANMLRSKGKGK